MPVKRVYDVVAMHVPIVYDAHGDHDRNGMIFTLAEHEGALTELRETFPTPFPDPLKEPERLPKPHPLVRPLVLRARAGERVVVRFRNELRRRAGIHAQGVGYRVRNADGGAVGRNPDSSVEPGGTATYEWDAWHEGVFHFGDLADLRGGEDGSQAHGLFGALVVEPEDATWTDPVTGDPLLDGLYADVHVPGRPSFREYTLFMQDETPNDNPVPPPHPTYECDRPRPHTHSPAAGGERLAPVLFPDHEGGHDGGHGDGHGGGQDEHTMSMMLMSYRTEPMGWRSLAYERLLERGEIDPAWDAIVGEEQHHSSWLFGDPETPIFRAYGGDPAKIRLVHAGVKETHVFHLHLHQWRAVPGHDESPIIDSITLGPQQAFTIEPIHGAGSVQEATGDIIFHCHLYPHFHSGMWGMWRVFDVLQDGAGHYPDGTPIAPLRPLPTRPAPPAPTPAQPGFPAFMDGSYPQKSPRPPRTPGMPKGMGREPSELERNAFAPDPQPGEAFTKVTHNPDAPVRRYHLVVMQGTLHYYQGKESGGHHTTWHDHRGVFFVLQEEIDAAGGIEKFQRELEEGKRRIEPIAIRARKGEVLELTLTNALPPGCHEATAFDTVLPFQPEGGLHVHLVKFDPLVADGASVGWNYLSGTTTADAGERDHERYRSWIYRWYCDEEFGVVFFHDHLLANERQRHGLFGSMTAEPEGAVWVDPHDHGREVRNAATAVVKLPDGTAFRERVVPVADFVPLFEHGAGETGNPINPPSFPGAMDDQGAMAVGYRCEPLHERPGDPADWFSSAVHGDPQTPMLRGYPGEKVRVRLYQGSHEEQHGFTTSGLRWHAWRDDPRSPLRTQQTIGISEAFSLHLSEAPVPGDYMWSFSAIDDTWLGCWGLFRFHEAPQADLPPLPGAFRGEGLPPFDPATARRYDVRAVAREIAYSDRRSDPFGLVYTVAGQDDGSTDGGPLVLRCRAGEWVEVTLTNEVDVPPEPTPYDPRLPALDEPAEREVSARVSLHPVGPLRYDVRDSDGAYAGRNGDGTVKPGAAVTYRWFADTPGVVLLEDRADVRTHRHRGLVGALVVEAADATPRGGAWTGHQATIRRPQGEDVHELVLVLQDGVRQYHHGDPTQPVTDLEDEPEDSGQKAFNYRSAHLLPTRPSLAVEEPGTPLLVCRPGDLVRVHLVVGSDRPRNHTFQIHGQTWPMEEHLEAPRVGAIGGLANGSLRTLTFRAGPPGDYAYRTGVFRWALTEGLWGVIHVR
ncbi:multicopper oxidase domain-containing protein [Actinomadura chibensis]|uniref:Multicopper oxidase domain-containing protein n=1 Tax=Actinomadura chibensis TaxID=392828 RepID=A0A5D0NIG9_9ACTN|nr:multicopper oxidase domain-containing protein [Actinomadura chibensis]TYB44220.1 multicopper oxidase domain-containing protein [Actinomadura chibensis]